MDRPPTPRLPRTPDPNPEGPRVVHVVAATDERRG